MREGRNSFISHIGNVLSWLYFGIWQNGLATIANLQVFKRRLYLEYQFKKRGLKSRGFFYEVCVVDIDTLLLGPRILSDNILPEDRYYGFCLGESFLSRSIQNKPASFKRRNKLCIYVSFGSMCSRYSDTCKVIENIISAASQIDNCRLILSGHIRNMESGRSIADFIDVDYTFDQARALAESDLAIVHGGYGTLKECITSKVPMIVVPFYFDQFKNAGIVVNKGIGKALQAEDATIPSLINAIRSIQNNYSDYSGNIAKLYDHQNDTEEFERAYSALIHSLGSSSSRLNSRSTTEKLVAGKVFRSQADYQGASD